MVPPSSPVSFTDDQMKTLVSSLKTLLQTLERHEPPPAVAQIRYRDCRQSSSDSLLWTDARALRHNRADLQGEIVAVAGTSTREARCGITPTRSLNRHLETI